MFFTLNFPFDFIFGLIVTHTSKILYHLHDNHFAFSGKVSGREKERERERV